MKSKVDPDSDVTQVLEIGQTSSRRKSLKRWLILVVLAAAAAVSLS